MEYLEMKRNFNTKDATTTALAIALISAAIPAHADLISMVVSAKTLVITAMSLINVIAGFVGAYFVFTGVMNWKKSSSEQGGHQMGFKEIIIPILSGVCLLGFSAFIIMTSQTFGLSSTTLQNL